MQNPFRKAVEKESDHLLIEEVIDHHRPNEDEGHPNVATTILCGSIAGIVAKTAVAPAERVKMKFQTSPDKFTIIKAIQYGDKIFQRGGLLSLWKGHSTTIIRVAPYSGISYAAHDYAELKFKKYLHTDSLPFVYKFLAGSIGGASGTFLTYPLDVLRVRLALTPGSNWVNTIKKGGLFQGLSPTMMGIIPYAGTSWMVKQTLNETFPTIFHRHPNLLESLTLNAAAGLCGQFVTYPLDVMRRRMQMGSLGEDGKLRSMRSTLIHLLETEGSRGLAKGFSLNIIKGPITLSLSLTTYDLLMNKINKAKRIKEV